MAAKFTISDSESEPSEDVGESETDQSSGGQETNFAVPELRVTAGGRVRLNSESQVVYAATRDDELQARADGEEPSDGAPFRGRSQSAPPALWAAKKYGRQLRRMSDEFDSWLDKGVSEEMKRVRSAGTARQMHHSRSWWSYLFSHQEAEAESNQHHDNHSNRTQ